MSSRTLLVDNDALLKAAHWNLLDLVPQMVGTSWPAVSVLPQFPPRVARAEPKLFADAAVAKSLSSCLSTCRALPDPDLSVVSALQGQPQLDAGEILLVGVLASEPDAFLLTGDKRALQSLCMPATLANIGTCPGRIICVEQLLWYALDQLGPDALVGRIRRWTPRDQTALAIVGSVGPKTENDLREGLRSYLRWINQRAPGLLMSAYGL